MGIVERLEHPQKQTLKIAVVGKYMGTQDSYKSVYEALTHGGIANGALVKIIGIDSELLTQENSLEENMQETFHSCHGILVPGGFGDRGIAGKIAAIRYARERNVPFFGICLGLQMACLEFARNVLGISDATSEDFQAAAPNQIIHLMANQQGVTSKGGSMRLGAYTCRVRAHTKVFDAYRSETVSERHRHRYEFNSKFRESFEKAGFIVSAESPNGSLVEMMELKNHPWFVACQAHPELKSRPIAPHPLFTHFVAAALAYSQKGLSR
jgi:CTP synthase